jgi:hypothetical protein
MPAHIGFLTTMKVPAAFLYQFQRAVTSLASMVVGAPLPLMQSKAWAKKDNMNATNAWDEAMGKNFVSPAEIYANSKKKTKAREHTVGSYSAYRRWMDRYGPHDSGAPLAKSGMVDMTPFPQVDKNEWELYLKAGTSFDQCVAAAFADGWKIMFITRKSDWNKGQEHKELKRLEATRANAREPITLWSRSSSDVAMILGS